MKQYFDVFKTIFKNNIVREFIYRSNTIAMTIADMIWVVVELAFFEVIYSNIGDINGWTKEQTSSRPPFKEVFGTSQLW
jgi:ABC-type uncharacterized transport system permease subunit